MPPLRNNKTVVPIIAQEELPALLVSYAQLHLFMKFREFYNYRSWIMDSGAFSAYNSGAEISLDDYIHDCKELLQDDKQLTEIFALDVIGDWRASLANTERMWSHGLKAIPCYHYNEPWSVLIGLARDYPKIALGGVAAAKAGVKAKWTEQCFARVWPCKIHGFAYGTEAAILGMPFHSVDATNWELRPRKFGIYDSFGRGSRIPVRGGTRNLRCEILRYLEIEQKARVRWHKEMSKLESAGQGPIVYLASADGMCLAKSGYGTELYEGDE